jgi:uncharacterized membrane protein HdeD (DUF308 family)
MNSILTHLASTLSRGWWLLVLRGIAAILFGVLAWFQPGLTLAALVLLFGAYSMADGVLCLWTAITGPRGHEYWWLVLLEGLVGIGIGLMTFFAPGITALALLFYIAIWAVATGILEIAAAIRLRKEMDNEWLLLLAGLASVAFGVLLAVQPAGGALALLWLIGSYAIVFGALLLILALKVRKFVPKVTYSTSPHQQSGATAR